MVFKYTFFHKENMLKDHKINSELLILLYTANNFEIF